MESSFSADVVPMAPADPLFGLMQQYKEDQFDRKVDLGIGAYRDDNAKPWILSSVKKVLQLHRHCVNVTDLRVRPTCGYETIQT